MTWEEVAAACREAKTTQVAVVGPNRAGTTISAAVLADALHLPFLPEETFGMTDVWRFFKLIESGCNGVIQAPSMTFACHHTPPAVAVVLVRRPLDEVYRSQSRIDPVVPHDWLGQQRSFYLHAGGTQPAVLKYQGWEEFQRAALGPRGFELDYGSLRTHRMWVPPERRAGFGLRQYRENDP